MEILINDLSLSGNFSTVNDFAQSLDEILKIQTIMEMSSVKLLKHATIYNSQITPTATLHDVLTGRESRQSNKLRKMKQLLYKLMSDPPFWDDGCKHKETDYYSCSYTEKKHGYALAEACERSKMVLSFEHEKFKENVLTIYKNGEENAIKNIIDSEFLLEYLYENNEIGPLYYCKQKFSNKNLSFDLLEEKYGFNILNKEEIKQFLGSFLNFSQKSWKDILSDKGLNYKSYKPSALDWFDNSQFKTKKIDKFRASQKFRCFGYREEDIFYVLRFELDHTISDYG